MDILPMYIESQSTQPHGYFRCSNLHSLL